MFSSASVGWSMANPIHGIRFVCSPFADIIFSRELQTRIHCRTSKTALLLNLVCRASNSLLVNRNCVAYNQVGER